MPKVAYTFANNKYAPSCFLSKIKMLSGAHFDKSTFTWPLQEPSDAPHMEELDSIGKLSWRFSVSKVFIMILDYNITY